MLDSTTGFPSTLNHFKSIRCKIEIHSTYISIVNRNWQLLKEVSFSSFYSQAECTLLKFKKNNCDNSIDNCIRQDLFEDINLLWI